jgi:hypothetical protein
MRSIKVRFINILKLQLLQLYVSFLVQSNQTLRWFQPLSLNRGLSPIKWLFMYMEEAFKRILIVKSIDANVTNLFWSCYQDK